MMKRFLVAIDGSEYAWRALDEAITYGKAIGAEIVAIHVVPLEQIPDELRRFAEVENVEPGDIAYPWRKKTMVEDKIAGEAERRLQAADVKMFQTLVHEGDPANCILAAAREYSVDAIFVGDRGLGALQHLIMGSVAHKVANLSKCTCVIVK